MWRGSFFVLVLFSLFFISYNGELIADPTSNNINVALSSNGAIASVSSVLPGWNIHQINHLNDGLYGNNHSWVSNEPGSGWIRIELAENTVINKLVWGRDNPGGYNDRIPKFYTITISIDGIDWIEIIREQNHNFNFVGENKIHEFNPIETRYVQMNIFSTVDSTEPAIDEFEIYSISCIAGDMNGNGELNTADCWYLARHLVGDPLYSIIHAYGDVDSSGSVNAADCRFLARHIVGDPAYNPLYP